MNTPLSLALAFAAGVAIVGPAQRLLQPAIADTPPAPEPVEVVVAPAPELPTAIDFSSNQSQSSSHGPLIAKNGSELAPYAPNDCSNFYDWPIDAADWNGNGAIDMEDEIKLCVD